ncbi:MAG: hypothetical protein FWE83_07100 [Oscillospiraceae bacterium]|nr:hypothetical protein [Oscillospiraceae bacterium]
MPRAKESTSTLLQRIFKTTSLERFIKRFDESEYDTPTFSEYISALCSERNALPQHIINKADIERTYGHQLFNGTRTPSRDKVLQLALGFGLSFDETQKLLRVAGKSALYPKIKRDAVIVYALNHGYDIVAVQTSLFDLSLPTLGEER